MSKTRREGRVTVLRRRAFLGAGALALLSGCTRAQKNEDKTIQSSFFCFDTACVIGGVMPREVLDDVVTRCQGFEQTLSRTIATSDIGRVNASGGAPTKVEPETADLVQQALGYCQQSGGLFDITIGAVSELWDFHNAVVPSADAIAAALPHVGWEKVEVDTTSCTVTLGDPDARLDLGGIAKGYVTDVVVDLLVEAGVQSAYVNLGGNVAVMGAKPDGSPWGVGVRDPNDESGEKSVAVVKTEGGSVVTSGLYERQFELDGKRYWHILDPRTGYPAESDIVSASLYTQRSLDGDGFTKPLFMLGLDAALAFLGERGIDGLLIDVEGVLHMTEGSSFERL